MFRDTTISVVMTTYNGQKYIFEQLDSILKQSINPDEVLIFDDCSTDDTVNIVQKFILDNELSNWTFIRNVHNKGWQKNFFDGIESSTGDIIFLADQDDIWASQKIEEMTNALLKNEQADMCMCECQEFWEDEIINTINKKESVSDVSMRVSTPRNCIIDHPGCSYCFRKSFFDEIKANWIESFPHDYFLYIGGWIKNSICVVDRPLHFFRRQRGSVTTKTPVLFDKQKRLNFVSSVYEVSKKLSYINQNGILVKNYLKWLELRVNMLSGNHVLNNAVRLIGLLNFYQSCRTYFTDFYVAVFK